MFSYITLLESVFHGYSLLVFKIVTLECVMFRNYLRITVTSPSSVVKTMNMSFFFNIMLRYYFSLEAILQDMAKNNPTKKRLDAKIQETLKHMPAC